MNKIYNFNYVEFPAYQLTIKTSVYELIKEIKTKDNSVNYISITIQVKINKSLYLTIGPKRPLNISSLVELHNYTDSAWHRYSTISEFYDISKYNIESIVCSYAIIDEKDYISGINAIKYMQRPIYYRPSLLLNTTNLPSNINYETWGKTSHKTRDHIKVYSLKEYYNSDAFLIVETREDTRCQKKSYLKLYNSKYLDKTITDVTINNSTERFKRIYDNTTTYFFKEKVYFIAEELKNTSYLYSLRRKNTSTLLASIIDIESVFTEVDYLEGKILYLNNYPGINFTRTKKYPLNLIFNFRGTKDIRQMSEYKNLFETQVGYYKVIATPPVGHPLVPVKNSNKWQAWYYSEDLKFAIELGYKFKILEGFIYHTVSLENNINLIS